MISNLLTRIFADAPSNLGQACTPSGGSFLGFPSWFHYLPGMWADPPGINPSTVTNSQLLCNPSLTSLSDVWLIVAAVIEILLRVTALVAIVMVVYGGVEFIMSQGEPEKANKARGTVINALIGLVIAVAAAAIITFIAGNFTAS